MSIFTRFSLRSLSGNRTRTVVSVIGIALSCALVCAVLTSVVSMSNMLYERTAADEGSWQVEAASIPADAHRELEGDGRVSARLDVAELGAIQMGNDNAADYGSYLFAKTWPVNPEGERLVTGPEIAAGRAPEAPGEIALPHYLEGVELAPCGLTVQGADGASAIELGSTVTAVLGERTLRYPEDGGAAVAGTSLQGTYFEDGTVERPSTRISARSAAPWWGSTTATASRPPAPCRATASTSTPRETRSSTLSPTHRTPPASTRS